MAQQSEGMFTPSLVFLAVPYHPLMRFQRILFPTPVEHPIPTTYMTHKISRTVRRQQGFMAILGPKQRSAGGAEKPEKEC
jgi:hypothetical protein